MLKDPKNALSVWKIESINYLDKAVLAIAASQHHLATFDIVLFEESSLRNNNLSIENSQGNTPVKSLVDMHRDITDLTYVKLGKLKDIVIDAKNQDRIIRYREYNIKQILNKAIEQGLLVKNDLKESIINKL